MDTALVRCPSRSVALSRGDAIELAASALRTCSFSVSY